MGRKKKIVSPLLEDFHFLSRAGPRTRRRRADKRSEKSLSCYMARLFDKAGKRPGRAGSLGEGVTSPTPHFPPPVYSFPRGAPRGLGRPSAVWISACGSAHRGGEAGVRRGLRSVPPRLQGSGAEG